MKFFSALWVLAFALTTSQVDAALKTELATTNCDTSIIKSESVFCCNGNCLDGTSMGKPGLCQNWVDECEVAPKCGNNQYGHASNMTNIESGDGCCYACTLNPQACQWEKFQWTWSCCDCPAGYISGSGGECGTLDRLCYACDEAGEIPVKNGTRWQCQTSEDSNPITSTLPSKSSSSAPALDVTGTGTATASSSPEPHSSGLSVGSQAGIGVGVTFGVAALVGVVAFILLKTGVMASIKGGTAGTAGIAETGGAGAGTGDAGMSNAGVGQSSLAGPAQTTLAGPASGSQAGGLAGTGSAQVGSLAGTGSSQVGGLAGTGSSHIGGLAGTGSSQVGGLAGTGSSHIGGLAGTGTSQIGGLAGTGSSHIGGLAGTGTSQVSGLAGTGTSHIGGLAGTSGSKSGGISSFFTAVGLRKKKEKDDTEKSEKKPPLAVAEPSQQPLIGEMDGEKNLLVPGVNSHEIGGEQISEADENAVSSVNEIDSQPRHELK